MQSFSQDCYRYLTMLSALNTKRILGLDGLRALSVLVVFFHHTGVTSFHGGYIGVEVFFVLSGFLITRNLLAEQTANGTINYLAFYIRRAKRLYPALILMLAAVLAYCLLIKKNDPFQETIPSLLYVMNWYRAFEWYDAVLTGHTWSLAIEEQFYLLWPLLLTLLLATSSKRTWVLIIILAAIAIWWRFYALTIGYSAARVYSGFDTHADGLLLGAVLACLPSTYLWKIGKLWLPASAYLTAILFNQSLVDYSLTKYGYGTVSIASAILISKVISDQKSLLVANLSTEPLAWLGRVSYGFYLWHYPIIYVMMYGGNDKILGFYGSLPYPIPMLAISVFSLTLAITAASWYLLESPILRWKPRSERKIHSNAIQVEQ